MERDERQLIEAACGGETAAFEALVRKYQQRLCTALTHLCGSYEEAEDVAQEALVQAFLKLHTFTGSSAFYTWLYRIAINAAISRRRRRRPEVSVEDCRQVRGDQFPDGGELPPQRLLREERAAQIRCALGRLSEEYRAILVLREIEGFAYDQIAEILGLPTGTVRSRLHRARLQLKEQLDALLGEAAGRG